MSSKELGNLLGRQFQDKNQIKPQLGKQPKIFTYLRSPIERLSVLQVDLVIQTKQLGGGGMIWGSTDFGEWFRDKWSATTQIAFVLGHADLGVLGTSQLGEQEAVWVDTVRRRWEWYTESLLNEGTYDANISTAGGEIKLV